MANNIDELSRIPEIIQDSEIINREKSIFKRKIYVAHPFGGISKNSDEVRRLVHGYIERYPEYLFFSPIHAFGSTYDETDYVTALSADFELLKISDELWLTGDWWTSAGCILELGYALSHNIPYGTIGTKLKDLEFVLNTLGLGKGLYIEGAI